MRKPVLPYANNKGADQPVHSRSLISAFVIRCLDSSLWLASMASFNVILSSKGISSVILYFM